MSPLTHGLNYRSTCDNHINSTASIAGKYLLTYSTQWNGKLVS